MHENSFTHVCTGVETDNHILQSCNVTHHQRSHKDSVALQMSIAYPTASLQDMDIMSWRHIAIHIQINANTTALKLTC